MLRKILLSALVAPFVMATSASAASLTIIEVHLGGIGQPDIEFVSGVLSTINDGNALTPGEQDTDVLYEGMLSSVADIVSGASFTLDAVAADGAPVVAGLQITQATTGGNFFLYGNDAGHTLLLSGTLGAGLIVGLDSSSIGAYLSSEVGTLTGGSLLSLLPPSTPVLIGFSLGSLTSASGSGLDVVGNQLANFTANGTGLVDVVPEPATSALLLSGLIGGAIARRKANKA